MRLDRASVLSGQGVRGELALKDRPDVPGRGLHIAQLMRDDKSYVIPLLVDARVVRITRVGLLIEGTELIPPRGAKGYDTRYEQAWWCEQLEPVR